MRERPPPTPRAALREKPPTTRWAALLGDLHFWIPLGAFAAGLVLLRWLA